MLPLLLFFGCGGGDDIQLAVAVPLTGNNSHLGNCVADGAVKAVDEWNQRGGIHGRVIRIARYDDQGDRQTAVTVARRLVARKVDGVIGHLTSECTMSAGAVYSDGGILMITPSATNPMITDRRFPNIFRLCGRDDRQGMALADFVNRGWKASRIVIIHDRSTYGRGLAAEFEKNLANRTDVVLYAGLDDSNNGIARLAERIRAVQADLIMFGGIHVQAENLIGAVRAEGVSCPFVTGDGAFSYRLLDGVPETEQEVYVSYSDQSSYPTGDLSTTRSADPFYQAGYTAVDLMLSAFSKAGTTSVQAVSDTLRTVAFPNPKGKPYRFDYKGDCTTASYTVFRIRGNRFEPVSAPHGGDVSEETPLMTEQRQELPVVPSQTSTANIKG